MAKKNLMFVDTNVLLDFYRARVEAGITLLKRVETVADSLIITQQVEMEFLSNRQRVVTDALQKLSVPQMEIFVPAYLRELRAVAALERAKTKIKEGVKLLQKRCSKLMENPLASDPVFQVVKKVFDFEAPWNLKFANTAMQKAIFEAGWRRFQRGFPPRKNQDLSCGDAINWEWVLACAKTSPSSNVFIVTNDNDFGLSKAGLMNDWLAQEFRVVSRGKLHLTGSLSRALEALGVKVTQEEKREERNMVEEKTNGGPSSRLPSYWSSVLQYINSSDSELHIKLKHAEQVTRTGKVLEIVFNQSDAMYLYELNASCAREFLQKAFKDLNLGFLKEIRFRLSKGEIDEWNDSVRTLGSDMPASPYFQGNLY